MSLKIPDVGYISLISLLEMTAFMDQKSQNIKTVILGRASQLRSLYPIGYGYIN